MSGIWTPELELTHRDLSELDLSLKKRASTDPRWLRRDTFADLHRDNPLIRYDLQSWPTFLSRAKVAELERASVGMSLLVRSVPQRVFGSDTGKMAAFYGFPDPLALSLVLDEPNGISALVSRGDFVDGEAGFQCVEFNMSSHLGGWETPLLADLQMRIPVVRELLETSGEQVSCRNTVRELFRHVLREVASSPRIDGEEVNVCIAMPGLSHLRADVERYLGREYSAVLEESGGARSGTVFACDYGDLEIRGGALYHQDRRIAAVVERHPAQSTPAFRCFKGGTLKLFNGPIQILLGDKRNLALLSELSRSDLWTAEERELLAAHLPWTRTVRPGRTTSGERSVDLLPYISERRQELVLKKARSLAGSDVVIGRFTTQGAWDAHLAEVAAGGDWIVQAYVESRPYLFQNGEHGCSPHDVVWGPFVFGSTYAGAILRVQPKKLEGIVNLTRGATEGVLFEVGGAPSAGPGPTGKEGAT